MQVRPLHGKEQVSPWVSSLTRTTPQTDSHTNPCLIRSPRVLEGLLPNRKAGEGQKFHRLRLEAECTQTSLAGMGKLLRRVGSAFSVF